MNNEKETHTIIPAERGWSLALLIEAGKTDGRDYPAYFYYEPIIAWEIQRTEGKRHGETWVSRYVVPITAEGTDLESTRNVWAIQRPDGKFHIPGDCTCDDEADALKHLSD